MENFLNCANYQITFGRARRLAKTNPLHPLL